MKRVITKMKTGFNKLDKIIEINKGDLIKVLYYG